ncbi:MAG: hypothetical protein Q8S84_08605 [bacterium]|nr:hypothetical protein [bacterium]
MKKFYLPSIQSKSLCNSLDLFLVFDPTQSIKLSVSHFIHDTPFKTSSDFNNTFLLKLVHVNSSIEVHIFGYTFTKAT